MRKIPNKKLLINTPAKIETHLKKISIYISSHKIKTHALTLQQEIKNLTHTNKHNITQKCIQINSNVHTHRNTDTHKNKHTQTLTHTHRYIYIQTHIHNTYRHTHIDKQNHTYKNKQPHTMQQTKKHTKAQLDS